MTKAAVILFRFVVEKIKQNPQVQGLVDNLQVLLNYDKIKLNLDVLAAIFIEAWDPLHYRSYLNMVDSNTVYASSSNTFIVNQSAAQPKFQAELLKIRASPHQNRSSLPFPLLLYKYLTTPRTTVNL
ncbi:MAG: hypothetical protein LBL30_03975 [Holosporales bacterium]|nr:hypothetical protein [Holosporales bacterium]